MFDEEIKTAIRRIFDMLNARPIGVPMESYREEIAEELEELVSQAYSEGRDGREEAEARSTPAP